MELKIDHTSRIPLHLQVEAMLRELIQQPAYQQGELLPREMELAKMLGISRNTIRQATNKLEYEGLLVRKKGVGTKVAGNSVTTHLDQWHSFTQEMNDQGVVLTSFLILVDKVEASPKVCAFFNIPAGTQVIKLSRLRGDTKGPFVYFESYFHPRIGLTGHEDFSRPLYDILENDYQAIPTLSKEQIRAGLASAFVAKRLCIKPGDPVLIRERFVLDPGNRPLEYNIGFYHAEKFTYSIDIRKS